MKLTKTQLKRIIKEELSKVMEGSDEAIEAFNDWKADVGAGSTVKQGIRGTVWEPVSGPWKDRYDQLKSAKGRSVGRYGSN